MDMAEQAMTYRNLPARYPDSFPPVHKANEEDMEAVGKGKFRCFGCQQSKSTKWFGGLIAGKRFCAFCYPYYDKAQVEHLEKVDKFSR